MRISSRERGTILLEFDTPERVLLTKLTEQLVQVIDMRRVFSPDVAEVTGTARLFPRAYPDDAYADEEFRQLTEDDLAQHKTGSATTVHDQVSTGGPIRLTPESATTWLTCITDLRLMFAARLGIHQDGDEEHLDIDSPHAGAYLWLGYLQEALVLTLNEQL